LGKGTFALDQVDLIEVSIVTIPANRSARIRSSKHINTKAEAVDFLRNAGLSKAAAARFAAGGFPALNATTDASETIAALIGEIKAAAAAFRKG
jgi:hypothetical protein